MISSFQLIVSAVTVGVVYYLYEKGKDILKGPAYTDPGKDGIDPNWKTGNKIGLKGKVDTHDTLRPSCQVWNDDQQVFLNAGYPQWDKDNSGAACFTNIPQTFKHVRFVKDDGTILFREEDPLKEDPSERGICYFFNGTKFNAFPFFAPVNKSRRLCFAAGETFADQGQIFTRNDGVTFYNPMIDDPTLQAEIAQDPTLQAIRPQPPLPEVPLPANPAPYCTLPLYGDLARKTSLVWTHNSLAASYDNLPKESCIANNGRWTDRQNGSIIYKNPYNPQQTVAEKILH